MGSLNHMCHYFQNIIPINIYYSIWQMVVILTMKHVNLCHQCAKSNLLYHTCLPKPCFEIISSRMFGRIVEARGTTVFGIKGENVFCQLTDIPDNLLIDWMHCVCKGILKRHAAIQMVVQSSVCCRFKQFARN